MLLAKRASTTLLILIITVAILAAKPAAAQQFVTIDYPGAADTYISQINDLGQMVGSYVDSAGAIHGLMLSAGTFTTIDFPGVSNTQLYGINDSGQMVGFYIDDSQNLHGFLYVNGQFTAINNPADLVTYPLDIDDQGNIVGTEVDDQGVGHGFVYTDGVFTSIDYPGAASTGVFGTNLGGGSLAGIYTLPSTPQNASLAFTDIDGQFTAVTIPQSVNTVANDANNGGQVAGTFALSLANPQPWQSFLLTGNKMLTLDAPGAISTIANSLNDLGQAVGWYTDGNNVTHGFLTSTGPFAYVAGATGITVIDTSTKMIVTTIPVPGGPWDVAMTPDQKHLYVTEIGTSSVAVLDTVTNVIVATIPVGTEPYSIAIAPNGNFAYVTNVGNSSSGTVSVIRTSDNTVVATVTVGLGPFGCAVTPDSASVYVSDLYDGTISVIDAATNNVTTTFPISAPVGMAFAATGASAYVTDYTTPGTVTVLAIPSNETITTIPLGTAGLAVDGPIEVAVTPDGTSAYVTDDSSSDVSVINTASNSVIDTTPLTAGARPFRLAITPDSSGVYVGNYAASTVSVLQTSTNTIVATIPITGGYVSGIAIASAPPSSQTVNQPLSPTQPNNFNFGTNSQTVQYPPGTNFNNVVMQTVAQQITQAEFQQQVAGTAFAKSACIVYGGNGGNCVEYLVTCTDTNGNPITCPGEPKPTIAMETAFTTGQSIVNPGYLTAPIGTKQWENIFTGFADPKVKGKTKGFSQFIAVSLGAGNAQGVAGFHPLAPFRAQDARVFKAGTKVRLRFELKSVVTHQPVTDAQAGLTIQASRSKTVVSQANAFTPSDVGVYTYDLSLAKYTPGRYLLTIYGNAFPTHTIHFTVVAP